MSTATPMDAFVDAIAEAIVAKIEARQRANGQRVLNTREAARYLGMSVHALRRRSAAGDIPNVRDGRDLRFDRLALDVWIAQRAGRGKTTMAVEEAWV